MYKIKLSKTDYGYFIIDNENNKTYKLHLTCSSTPEQYDLYNNKKEQIGYFRLRYGNFTVDTPTCRDKRVFEFDEFESCWVGEFKNEEDRIKYLTQGVIAVINYIKNNKIKKVKYENNSQIGIYKFKNGSPIKIRNKEIEDIFKLNDGFENE